MGVKESSTKALTELQICILHTFLLRASYNTKFKETTESLTEQQTHCSSKTVSLRRKLEQKVKINDTIIHNHG